MTDERRQFNRVSFDGKATLYINNQELQCQIIDLSLHGVLLKLQNTADLKPGIICKLDIPLGEQDQKIDMELKLMHNENSHFGLKCLHIDLNSITHLRRLIELNLGNPALLDREFEALCRDNS